MKRSAARLDKGGNDRFKLPATAVLDKLILALERPNPAPHYYVTTPTHVVALHAAHPAVPPACMPSLPATVNSDWQMACR